MERAEEDEPTAELLNHKAAGNLAAAAKATGATLFHVSTDYVFDGTAHTPYRGGYGSLAAGGVRAHETCRRTCRHGVRVPVSDLPHGVALFGVRTQLPEDDAASDFGQDTLQVVFDQIGTPTYAGDLALAIFSIIESERYAGNEGVYHFTDEGVCSWYDFATEIAAAAGHDSCHIIPCHTSEFPTKAARPAYSVLDKTKIKTTFQMDIPHWREAMIYCLKQLAE